MPDTMELLMKQSQEAMEKLLGDYGGDFSNLQTEDVSAQYAIKPLDDKATDEKQALIKKLVSSLQAKLELDVEAEALALERELKLKSKWDNIAVASDICVDEQARLKAAQAWRDMQNESGRFGGDDNKARVSQKLEKLFRSFWLYFIIAFFGSFLPGRNGSYLDFSFRGRLLFAIIVGFFITLLVSGKSNKK